MEKYCNGEGVHEFEKEDKLTCTRDKNHES